MQLILELRPELRGRQRDRRADWLRRSILPHEPWLRTKLKRLGVPDGELEDVIQDTYVRLLNARRIDHVQDYRSYLLRTARSVILTQVRRSACVREEVAEEGYFTQLPSPTPGPDAALEGRRELARVQTALNGMTERTRQVVALRRLERLSTKETANVLGVSPSTIEKNLAAAMRNLRGPALIAANTAEPAPPFGSALYIGG